MDKRKNYYEVLEVAVDSSPEEIQRHFIRAKNTYSSDSIALYSILTSEECVKMVDKIEEAYSILSDPEKRNRYNQARNLPSYDRRKPRDLKTNLNTTTPFDRRSENVVPIGNRMMPKAVAQQKYNLEYSIDNELEKHIEQLSDWNGEELKKVREYKNVSLERLAEMTKVSKTYLRYIEEESFNKLPAPVYARGFVYQYAKSLKLNPEIVATSYLYRLKQSIGA